MSCQGVLISQKSSNFIARDERPRDAERFELSQAILWQIWPKSAKKCQMRKFPEKIFFQSSKKGLKRWKKWLIKRQWYLKKGFAISEIISDNKRYLFTFLKLSKFIAASCQNVSLCSYMRHMLGIDRGVWPKLLCMLYGRQVEKWYQNIS